jgi:hypothetical protein
MRAPIHAGLRSQAVEPRTEPDRATPRLGVTLGGWVDRRRPVKQSVPLIAFAGLLGLTGIYLLYLTRGNTFYADEWSWVLYRRGNTVATFLQPWNEHMSLIPIAIYRLLFATVGLRHYAPYRVIVTVAHLLVTGLLFLYARRRIGVLAAVIASVMLLYLGPAWDNFLWPFQMAWLISLAAGLGALLMLDRRDRRGDIAACALVAVSLGSSGIGLMVALGVAVDVVFERRRWRDVWIFAIPLVPYAVWWSQYESPNRGNVSASWLLQHNIPLIPSFAGKAAAVALSALWGLAGQPTRGHAQTALAFGWVLLAVAVGLLIWRFSRLRRLPPRVAALLTMALSFWVLTAIRRADYSLPYESRYLYVSAVFIILVAVELGRGVRLPRKLGVVVTVAALAAVVSNVMILGDAAATFRKSGPIVRAETGALDIGRPVVSASLVADPWQRIVAGPYFAAEKAIGTPAASPAQIATMPEFARVTADVELMHIHRIGLRPGASGAPTGTRPTVESVSAGAVSATSTGNSCVVFHAKASGSTGSGEFVVIVPSGGLLLRSAGGPASVAIRRFATGFEPVGVLTTALPTALPISRDLARQPWRVRVLSRGSVTACGLTSL